jgi:hypothetical protein
VAGLVFEYIEGIVFLSNLPRNNTTHFYRAESVGDYALFAGGSVSSAAISDIEVWDSSLVKQNNLQLSYPSLQHTSTTIGNYALFGLFYNYSDMIIGDIDVYNASLTKTVLNTFQKTYRASAGRVGDYALFMAGQGGEWNIHIVTCVDSSLATTSTSLANEYWLAAGGENSAYCFIGGFPDPYVEAFDASLTKYICSDLSDSYGYMSGAGNGSYWIVLQGDGADVYDTSLTKSILPLPSYMNASYLCAFSNRGNYAFFLKSNLFFAINRSLVCSVHQFIENQDECGHGTCLGKYILCSTYMPYIIVAEIRD